MPDFLSYSMHQREERVIHGDVVELSAERWQWLVDFIRKNYADLRAVDGGSEITVYEPTVVNGIMFLPARYRGPGDPIPAEPALRPDAPLPNAYQAA